MNIVAIIQARMGSTRLPGKVLKKLGSETVLSYVVQRSKQILGVNHVVVATSELPQDDTIATWCKENNIDVCRGPESDVLSRYINCAKKYNPDYVMRITADCPFVDYEMASEIVGLLEEKKVDIVDVKENLPRGLAVELVSYDALQRIDELGLEERHREHVTYYAYEFKESFSRIAYEIPDNRKYPQFRITLDTPEDYEVMQAIANHFNNPLVSSVKVIDFLRTHPEVAKLNAHIEQKPVI